MSEKQPKQVVIPDASPEGKDAAWGEWLRYSQKSDRKKNGVVAGVVLVEGAAVVGSVILSPALLCLTPAIFGVAGYLRLRIDSERIKYYHKNWIEPYGSYPQDIDMKSGNPE